MRGGLARRELKRRSGPLVLWTYWGGRMSSKRGVDIEAKGGANNTGLMLASQRGRRDMVEMLLGYGASVELKNDYGGTSLGSTMYFLANHPVPDADYAGVIELLLNAGSEFNFSDKATGNDEVDDMLRRRGVII